MSLGETICRLRTARNMSQGDLAELLDVSRQSISKWETDGATPELDKLVKLASLFEVTLDELVNGATPKAEPVTDEAPPPQVVVERREAPGRKAASIVLLCIALAVLVGFTALGTFLTGVVLAVPFLVCGLICWRAKSHPLLWCLWALFLMASGYIHSTTGLTWAHVSLTSMWEESLNYASLAVAWALLLCRLALLVGTAVRLRNEPLEPTKRAKRLVLLGCVLFLLLQVPWSNWALAYALTHATLVNFLFFLQDSLELVLLTALVTAFLRWRKAA